MRNGTFNTSKCRGKLQKMGVLYTHSHKSPGPFPKLPKKKFKKSQKKKKQKIGTPTVLSGPVLRPAGDEQSLASLHFFPHVVNSSSLALGHARPT
jgi:hypothetical protein